MRRILKKEREGSNFGDYYDKTRSDSVTGIINIFKY